MAKIRAEAERLAIEIAHKSNNHLLAHSKSPNALATAYIYIATYIIGCKCLKDRFIKLGRPN